MQTYHVNEPTTVEFHTAFHGRIRVSFETGEVVPESEQDELALERLVRLELAEPVETNPEDKETAE